MEGDDTVDGRSGDDALRGQSGDDELTGGQGDDVIDGGEGDDIAVFSGNRDEYTVTRNEEGIYSVSDSVEGRDGSDTVRDIETFRFADGDYAHGEEVLADPPQEAYQTTIELSFVATDAGHDNTVGVYTVNEDGTIENVEIAFGNVKDNDAGDSYELSVTGDEQAEFGLFIVADGADQNDFTGLDIQSGELRFIVGQGSDDERLATIHDDPADVSLVFNDGQNTHNIEGDIYHDTPELNPQDLDHVQENDVGESTQRLGFEDLPGLGDADFNDVQIDVSITTKAVSESDNATEDTAKQQDDAANTGTQNDEGSQTDSNVDVNIDINGEVEIEVEVEAGGTGDNSDTMIGPDKDDDGQSSAGDSSGDTDKMDNSSAEPAAPSPGDENAGHGNADNGNNGNAFGHDKNGKNDKDQDNMAASNDSNDGNNGHGNDADGVDESNPGNGGGRNNNGVADDENTDSDLAIDISISLDNDLDINLGSDLNNALDGYAHNSPNSDIDSNMDHDMPAMTGRSNGWTDIVENDEVDGIAAAGDDDNASASWADTVENAGRGASNGKSSKKDGGDKSNEDQDSLLDISIDINISDVPLINDQVNVVDNSGF